MKRLTIAALSLTACLGFSSLVHANEFTDVIDAFDDSNNDPFDISISLGYERIQRNTLIRRETYATKPHDWDYFSYRNMFKSKQVTHILHTGLDIGLYKDLALHFGLPLFLNDTRELTNESGMVWDSGTALFNTGFKSPERSGVDYMAIGLRWGILDQGRDESKPNWTFYGEGRLSIGEAMEAGCASASAGTSTNCTGDGGGISRGLNELVLGTRLSRRYGIIDPFFGFEVIAGWAKEGTAYFYGSDNAINMIPPVIGSLDFGMEFIPWEVPEADRKLVIGIGAGAKYHSEGREYTPLFDALGTSTQLTNRANPAYFVDFDANGSNNSTAESAAAKRYSGLTDVENYATFHGRLFVMIQPAKYVKFRLGTGLAHESEHFITKTDQCKSTNINSAGLCPKPNYSYRPEVDSPGRRFRAEKTLIWSLFLDAVAMF